MDIKQQTPGATVPISGTGDNLIIYSFRCQGVVYPEIEINISEIQPKYQRDNEYILRLYTDPESAKIALSPGRWQVAEIVIPGRTYHQALEKDENGCVVLDENNEPRMVPVLDEIIVDDLKIKTFGFRE